MTQTQRRTIAAALVLGVSLAAGCVTSSSSSNTEGGAGCPSVAPDDGDACRNKGASCDYHSPDQGCICGTNSDGQLEWTCIPELLDCPTAAPTSGAKCNGLRCAYPGTTCDCNGSYSTGVWAWECTPNDLACPESVPEDDATCAELHSLTCKYDSAVCFCSAGDDWTCSSSP